MDRITAKAYIVQRGSVTKPYGKDWSVSITLGSDINETGPTIEKAYCKLTERIMTSAYLRTRLEDTINAKS